MNNNFGMPYREQNSNKGTFGKVLNFAGSKNYYGAAYLSSISILKIGAGYVALSTEKDIIHSVSTLLPETIFLSHKEGLNQLENYSVILIGCGLGQTKKSVRLFKKVINKLHKTNIPIVIDADGLNILSKSKIDLPTNIIITPHPMESARLLGVNIESVLKDFETSAKRLSEKYNCVTVLKNHRTVICDKSGEIFINQHGNSALAKAGTGDVLAGIIAGLVAQKMPLFKAAKLGVYLHSRAGELASKELTEYSVLASDLLKFLPKAINEIL